LAIHFHIPVAIPLGGTTAKDFIHILAYKMLQILIFSFAKIFAPNFAPIQVLHLASKMLEGKVPMLSLEVAQLIIEPSMEKDLVNLQAKLAIEAIAIFEEGVLQQEEPPLLLDAPSTRGVAYLVDVVVRST